MPTSTRSRHKDVLLWSVSAGLVLLGVGLYAGAGRGPFAGLGPELPDAGGSPVRSPAVSPSYTADPRPLAFQQRLTALRPLETAILRAFLSASAPAQPRPGLSFARVAPGRTPQACLAQAVYYEARGEPAEGQAAVAQVVLNRTRSGRHPADVCGAVFEGAARPGCQFSFACDSRLARRALEPAAWRRAQGVAAEVIAGRGPVGLQTATNYHADSVRPRWAAQLQRTAEIGRHIFYASASATRRILDGWTFTAPAPPSGA